MKGVTKGYRGGVSGRGYRDRMELVGVVIGWVELVLSGSYGYRG